MKPQAKALEEWVSDEILFDDTHLSGKTVFTREEFGMACRMMRGGAGMSVPVLHEAIEKVKGAMRRAAWSPDKIDAWLDSFFAPGHLVRYVDTYEIKRALTKKDSKLHELIDGTLFNVMK
jgi:hypothetical protein